MENVYKLITLEKYMMFDKKPNENINIMKYLENYNKDNVSDNSLAGQLHGYYNVVGIKEGWLNQEYATPLSKQDKINQQKNIDAAIDVVSFWLKYLRAEQRGAENLNVPDLMKKVVEDFNAERHNEILENAAESQHVQWCRFVSKYQKERVTPGHEKFRKDNYRQLKTNYKALNEKEKGQDRLIVAVVTDFILANSNIGYSRQINF